MTKPVIDTWDALTKAMRKTCLANAQLFVNHAWPGQLLVGMTFARYELCPDLASKLTFDNTKLLVDACLEEVGAD